MKANSICQLNVTLRDNNDDLERERDYEVEIIVDITDGTRKDTIIDATFDPETGEIDDFYNDEDFAKDVNPLGDILTTEDMIELLNTTIEHITSTVIEYPEFQYDSVPSSYAPWSHSDSPPESTMPYCINSSAGDYVFDVVRVDGKLKLIEQ